MKKSSCKVHVLQYFPLSSRVEDFRSTYIANCLLNSFLCYNTIILNIVTIHAIRKTSSMPKTLKTLLLSLAVSDVGVGLLAQPFYISLLINGLQETDTSCSTYKVFDMMTGLFPIASFLGVVAVSVDRFLAIQFHLRYQELVTHKRVVAVVISIWVFSVSFSLMALWVPEYIKFTAVCAGGVVGLLLTTVVYIRMYLVVRRHRNHIQSLQVQQASETGQMSNFASLRKSAVGIFYVYMMFWVCYVPFFATMAAIRLNGPSIALHTLFLLSVTLAYLNSSLNPLIYCWKMRNIRNAVMDTLRNMPCHRDHPQVQRAGHGMARLTTFSVAATASNLNLGKIDTNELDSM